jgi:hypothetical protein
MRKTFALAISNTSNEIYEFDLFKTANLPEGVTINVHRSTTDYAELRTIANCSTFKGNVFLTDSLTPLEITLKNNGIENRFMMESFHTFPSKIVIDGIQNYLTITIPAKSKFLLHLENYKRKKSKKTS